jgi:RNA polymerase sigma-70 factor (ECF subfamily)
VENGVSEEVLVSQVSEGNRDAFRLLFERFQPILFRAALYRVRDADRAHDLVQETFLRIWQHRSSLKAGHKFLPYAFRICDNLFRDALRHLKVRERLDAEIPSPAFSRDDDPEGALHVRLLEERISAIINEDLPVKCRNVFRLSRFEGKSNREIAGLLGLSVKTVENQITRALKILHKRLRGFL